LGTSWEVNILFYPIKNNFEKSFSFEMLNEVFKYIEGHNGGSSYNDKIPGFGVKHN